MRFWFVSSFMSRSAFMRSRRTVRSGRIAIKFCSSLSTCMLARTSCIACGPEIRRKSLQTECDDRLETYRAPHLGGGPLELLTDVQLEEARLRTCVPLQVTLVALKAELPAERFWLSAACSTRHMWRGAVHASAPSLLPVVAHRLSTQRALCSCAGAMAVASKKGIRLPLKRSLDAHRLGALASRACLHLLFRGHAGPPERAQRAQKLLSTCSGLEFALQSTACPPTAADCFRNSLPANTFGQSSSSLRSLTACETDDGLLCDPARWCQSVVITTVHTVRLCSQGTQRGSCSSN